MQGQGIRLKALLDVPALAINADHVTVHSGDGKYSACLTLAQALEWGFLVYELDGEPLPESKGGPFRLVTPGLGDLCANVKGVERIEVTIGTGTDYAAIGEDELLRQSLTERPESLSTVPIGSARAIAPSALSSLQSLRSKRREHPVRARGLR